MYVSQWLTRRPLFSTITGRDRVTIDEATTKVPGRDCPRVAPLHRSAVIVRNVRNIQRSVNCCIASSRPRASPVWSQRLGLAMSASLEPLIAHLDLPAKPLFYFKIPNSPQRGTKAPPTLLTLVRCQPRAYHASSRSIFEPTPTFTSELEVLGRVWNGAMASCLCYMLAPTDRSHERIRSTDTLG